MMSLDAVLPLLNGVAACLLTTTGVLLAIVTVLLTAVALSFHGSLFSGPGPWGVPILGYYPFLKKGMHLQLHKLAQKYGPVYKLNVCGKTYVYMQSLQAIRESHLSKSDDFPHRLDGPSLFSETFAEGIFLVKDEHWKILRKFVNQSLREIGLGAGSDQLREQIGSSVKSTLDYLSRCEGEPVDIGNLLVKEATQVSVRPYLGENVSQEDVEKIAESYSNIFIPFVDGATLLNGNFARRFVLPWYSGYPRFCKGVKEMDEVLHKIVDQHKASFDKDQQPRDFIDVFLRERELRTKKGDSSAKYFTDRCLVRTLVQIYSDGTIGLGLFIASYVYEVSKHLDVQNAIYEEILNVVGTERLPTLEDRSSMPFTNSVIKELFRKLVLFPILPGLECVRDTSVMGVKVPKGAIALVNYWAVHNDPDLYKNPGTFDATRFLPDKGKVEPPITFGVGKRSCAGEGIVMAETFMFMTAIIQNYIIRPHAEQDGSFHKTVEGECLIRVTARPTRK